MLRIAHLLSSDNCYVPANWTDSCVSLEVMDAVLVVLNHWPDPSWWRLVVSVTEQVHIFGLLRSPAASDSNSAIRFRQMT